MVMLVWQEWCFWDQVVSCSKLLHIVWNNDLCVCVCMSAPIKYMYVFHKARRRCQSPWNFGNWTWVSWRSNECSWQLSHLLPRHIVSREAFYNDTQKKANSVDRNYNLQLQITIWLLVFQHLETSTRWGKAHSIKEPHPHLTCRLSSLHLPSWYFKGLNSGLQAHP